MGRGHFAFSGHCNKSLAVHVFSNQALDVLSCIVLLLQPFIYALVFLVRVKAYDKLLHRPFAVGGCGASLRFGCHFIHRAFLWLCARYETR